MHKLLGVFIALVAVNNILSLTPGLPTALYYGVFAAVFFIFIIREKPHFNAHISFLAFAAVMSIALNEIPQYFSAWQRLMSFFFVILLISPWFYQGSLARVRFYMFKFTNILLIIIVMLSFLGHVTGIFPGLGLAGLFQGLTNHSMILGPISAVVMLILTWKSCKSQNTRFQLLLYIAMSLMSFFCIILSGSRGSLLAGILSLVILLLGIYKERLSKIFTIFIVIIGVMISTFSYWSVFTENIERKMQYAEESGDDFVSRSELWNYRVEEAKSSPVIGIGFASAKYGEINTSNGRIEPGTSWGALLAQIGVLGTVPLLFLLIVFFNKLRKATDFDKIQYLLIALLSFFVIHMVVEGYVLASGNFLFFYFWLLLGFCYNYIKGFSLNLD